MLNNDGCVHKVLIHPLPVRFLTLVPPAPFSLYLHPPTPPPNTDSSTLTSKDGEDLISQEKGSGKEIYSQSQNHSAR